MATSIMSQLNTLSRFGAEDRCLNTSCKNSVAFGGAILNSKLRHSSSKAALASVTMEDTTKLWHCAQTSYAHSFKDARTLDRWLEGSIVEIVKNLQDAPFLHFVYNSTFDEKLASRCKVPKGSSDCRWSYVQDSIMDIVPDGLILIQRLDKETESCLREATLSMSLSSSLSGCQRHDGSSPVCKGNCLPISTDMWGVLVQGKNIVSTACYILQTTRVAISGGGSACTRFCLTRAQSLGPSLQAQLEKMWLL